MKDSKLQTSGSEIFYDLNEHNTRIMKLQRFFYNFANRPFTYHFNFLPNILDNE